MFSIFCSSIRYIGIFLIALTLTPKATFANLEDRGGYHIRFLKERSCIANSADRTEPVQARPCRTIGDDPRGIYDPFGPFYVLILIRDHDNHKWLEARLTHDCITVTPPALKRRPLADMCRPGSEDQKWEIVLGNDDTYRVRHFKSKLCLGHPDKSQHVIMLPCQDDATQVSITLQDPYPSTALPPYPVPHEG